MLAALGCLQVLLTVAGCFVPGVVHDLSIRCGTDDDCPEGARCAPVIERCESVQSFGAVCGDGVRSAVEDCDDGRDNSDTTPDACRTDCHRSRCGDGVKDTDEACDDGDDNSDTLTDACRTSCSAAACGDGVIDAREECDNGGANDDVAVDACRTDCRAARCGDGVLDSGEGCDDGPLNSDVRAGACRTTCVGATCGDGVRDPGEGCDEGAANSDGEPDACRTTCVRATCGDGVVDGDEECDDGVANGTAPDACRATCVRATCGDGIVDTGEACDTGAQNSDVRAGACRTNCVVAACGDGVRDPGEGCDEGAANSDGEPDACRTTCVRATCGDGVVDGDEECDDGVANGTAPDACRATCVRATCGDGVIDSGEACDTGAQNSDVRAGACRTTCVGATCGDGVRDPGEGCDEGALNDDTVPGACRTTCVPATCGDGVVDDGEACDDGDVDSGDGCRGDCGKVERCGDGIVDHGEACDDANGNPRDGCDACRLQTWSSSLVVSGTVEGRAAAGVALAGPFGVALDRAGRVYVADAYNHRILRMDADGTVSHVAGIGTGEGGFSGDGGPAAFAALNMPAGVAVDAFGRVFFCDSGNQRVRRIDVDGTITTIAGTGVAGDSGDGGPAVQAKLLAPTGIAVDAQGRVLFSDSGNHRIRRIDATGVLTTVVGTGADASSGDGGPATSAALRTPGGIVLDPLGRVVFADYGDGRVRRIDDSGVVTTLVVAPSPWGLAYDGDGRLVIGSVANYVFRLESDGRLTTLAGTGETDAYGDGGPATGAAFYLPLGIAVDQRGGIVIADHFNYRVRYVRPDGVITAMIGTGDYPSPYTFARNGGWAKSTALADPRSVVVDAAGRIFFGDPSQSRIGRVETDSTLTMLAGTGAYGVTSDGAVASSSALATPLAVGLDAEGRVLFSELFPSRVRRIEANGTLSTAAGGGSGGDGGPATAAALGETAGLAIDNEGRLLIVTSSDGRVRRVEHDGTISTVAGSGTFGFAGDGGAATAARLFGPTAVVVDHAGRIVIADTGNQRVRRVALDGTISTIAGTGAAGFSGDGGPATLAALSRPSGLAVDDQGRVVIADADNVRLRRIEHDDTITTIAGTGFVGHSGDGGPAVLADLGALRSLAADSLGRLYVGDVNEGLDWFGDSVFLGRIRRIDVDGTIETLLGPQHPAGPGQAARARLYPSNALWSLSPGALLSVGRQGRALLVDLAAARVDVVVGDGTPAPSASARARFAPLLGDVRGVAFDPVSASLVFTTFDAPALRVIGVDRDHDGAVDAADTWSHASLPTSRAGLAGIAFRAATDSFVVVDEAAHCVRSLTRDGVVGATLYGRCGEAGSFAGLLHAPTHVAVSPVTGALYIADTGNHRVLRVQDGVAAVVLGDGSVSSAGEGAPARLFPVNAPRQLAFDGFGNLYVASTTTVRLVVESDGDGDADGDDRVVTLYGGGARETFPASDALCLGAIAVDGAGVVYVADTCQGFVVRVAPASQP